MSTEAGYLSVRSASLYLDGVAENTIRQAIASRELPAARFGRALRIAKPALDAWAESKAMQA